MSSRLHPLLLSGLLATTLWSDSDAATTKSDEAIAAAAAAAANWLIDQGQRYEYGIGVSQQLDRAIEYYCQAADLDHPRARFHLGWLYASGRLGAVDEVLAAAWFQAAQALGHREAEIRLRQLDALERELPERPHCLLPHALVERRLPPKSADIGTGIAINSNTGASDNANSATSGISVRELGRADIRGLVERLAPNYQLDPKLVLALIQAESNFDPSARSPKDARGLMQLIPATAQRFGVTDIWDPVQNMRGGMAYLRWLLDHFNGDLKLALAGYNAGEGAVRRHGGIPPYPETQAYVKRIIAQLEPTASAPALGPPR
jgi:soluble lytic murein transglycosylase-like protein